MSLWHKIESQDDGEKMDKKWLELKKMVDEQAEDEGLWFMAETAAESYLQHELRKLHAEIECQIWGSK